MAAANYFDLVQKLYIAFYQRPADPGGLLYWSQRLDAANGNLEGVIDAFASSAEANALYGAINKDTVGSVVDKIYQALFNRTPDEAGKKYYVDGFLAGKFTAGTIVLDVLNGASNDDLVAINNKVTVANRFTETVDGRAMTDGDFGVGTVFAATYAGDTDAQAAREILAGVTSNPATMLTAGDVTAQVQSKIADQGDAVAGQTSGETFTLTNGTDAATANVFNAGAVYSPGGNDRINSLQDEDVLTGTAGRTDNKLNLTLANSNDNVAAGSLVTPTLNNIQTIDAAYSNTDGTGLDLQDATGLTNVNITRVAGGAGSNARVLNLPDTAVNLSVANSADRSQITLTYRDGDLVGTENVNVALSNVFTAGLTIGGQNNVLSEQIETINLTVNSLSVVEALDTKEDGLAATGQTINLVANANFIGGNDADDDGNVIEHNNFFTGVAGVNSGTGVSAINVTGAGNVTLGSVGAADDVVGNAIVDAFTLNASAATGNIAANISNSAADAQSSFTTGTGADTLLAGALAVDLNSDGVADAAPVLVNLAADVATNNGDDTVNVSGAMTVTGSILTGEGNDVVAVQGGLAGAVTGGGTINLGAGDDTLVLGRQNLTNAGGFVAVAEEANVLAGDGNDTVILTGATAGDTAGDTEDDLGANVDLGAGDDTVIFDLTNQANIAGTLIDGTLVGGTGTNTLTVTGNASVGNVANYDPTAIPATDAVTGFSTLNLVSEQAYSAGLVTRINTVVANTLAIVQNDAEVEAAVATANTQTADYTVDASEFTGLTTINLDNQAGVTAAAENNSFAGDAATYTLNNLVGTEAVTLTTVEAATGATATRGVGGVTQAQITADVTADATLNVGLADATPANQTFAATLNGNGDVAINDNAAGQYAQVTLATQTNEIENLNLTIGGDTSRSIILADSHFEGTLTLGGTNTQTITVGAVVAAGNAVNAAAAASASTVTSTLTGSVNLTVSDNEAHTITTAATGGNDVVNLLNDTLTTADTINLGGGTADRIILDDDIRGAAADTDAVFKTISGVEQLELRGADALGGTIDVSLDNDALISGIDTIVVDLDADALVTADGEEANVDLNIDAAFTRALTITMANESTLDIDNKGNGNLNITIAGREGATRTQNDAIDTQLDLTDAGTGNVVNITINTANVAQTVSAVATGAQGIVLTNNLTGADASPGDIDRITLVDSDANLGGQTATATNPVTTQAGAITVTGSAQWAQAGDTLVVDASSINDDDGTALDENVAAGFPDVGGNEDTQTVVLNFAGMNYAVNLTGSEMNNGTSTIGVGAVRVLNADVFLNAAFDDVLVGGNVADTISGGAGMDLIQGGTGGDRLTGGTEADTFVFTAAADSNAAPNSLDTITDFVSGTDKIRITLTASNADVQPAGAPDGIIDSVVNASSFSVVNNAGGGDNSLAGNNTTNNAKVIGDAYYSSTDGQLAVDMDGDGDITTANDLVVSTAAVAATDLQFVINGTGGADVIRGGQGQDDIQAGAGNDTIVLVGSLTAAEAAAYSVAGAGVVNATVGRVLAYNELLSARTATEAVAGEKIDGQGAGDNDNLEIFGTVDLTQVTLANIETLTVHSTVTLTDAQLVGFTTIALAGNTPHTITVTNTDGNLDTVAAVLAKLSIVGAGANTTVSITGTDGVLVAAWNATNNRLEVTSNTSATVAPAGTVVTTLLPAAPTLSVAAAALYSGAYSLSDTAGNLAGAAASVLNNATNIAATTPATVAQATTIVNATNSGTNTYNLSDSSANLAAAAAAVGNGAGTIAATDPATVAQATAIEAFTNSGANTYNITDSAAALAASSNAVLALAGTVTASTNATVAQAATIDGFAKAVTFSVSDTALNLAAATDAQLDEAAAVSASNVATVAQGVAIDALATAVTFNVADTAANIALTSADNGGVGTNGYDEAGTIAATTTATAAQAGTIAGYIKAVVYSVSDTAAALAGAAGGALNEAVNLTATTAATVAEAGTIEAATNTGTNTYNITDSAANLATAGNAVLALAGTVTANTNATVAQATTIDGFAKAVTFAVVDSANAISGSTDFALDEATSITANTNATAAESASIDALTVAVTYNVVDSSANLAGSSSANLDEAGTVTANDAATALQAATIAGFAKAVTFNTTDDVTDLVTNLTGAALTEARSVGTVTADDAAAALATALTSGDGELSYLVNSVEVITVNDAAALTLNAQQFGNFINGSVTLGTGEAMIVAGDATANLGTLSSYGGSGTLTLGVAAGSNAYTANLGTSGVTTINLLGTGNHDVTASGSLLETFVLGADYDGGGVLRGLTSGDLLDVDGANAINAFTAQQVNAGDVDAVGEWHFASGVLTYFDSVATATVSIGLVGVTNVLSDNSDTFTIV